MKQLLLVFGDHSKSKSAAWLGLWFVLLASMGCSDGSFDLKTPDRVPSNPAPTPQVLIIGEEYEVFSNDTLEPNDADTEVSVRHELASGRKYVTVMAGGAVLLRSQSDGEASEL